MGLVPDTLQMELLMSFSISTKFLALLVSQCSDNDQNGIFRCEKEWDKTVLCCIPIH